jgi:biopolymer transport protein TolR
MKPKRPPLLRRSEINITPLIDVLLVLLVIFMVITPLNPTLHEASVPQQAEEPRPESATSPLVISIEATGRMRISQEAVEPPELGSRLEAIFRSRADRTIYLSADSDLLFNDVVSVIAVARRAGASRVGLMTEAVE